MTLDYFVEISETKSPQNVEEFTAVYHRLITNEKKKDADQQHDAWSKQAQKTSLSEPESAVWKMISQPTVEFAFLPPCSFALQFTFTLARPYLSKDDNPFYIIDNPIVRDKVFRLPLVRPTSWKGNLYSALWQLGRDKENDAQMQRLFGDIRAEESGQAGRLFFYPTFFTQTSLEIINPHDRKRRVGKNPILFESVPADAQGAFFLLYVPLDLIGQAEAEIKKQAAEDFGLIAEGLQAMFLTYGVSAKRTSGFGVAQENVKNGFVQIRIEETPVPPAASPPAAELQLPKYLQAPGKLKDAYLNPDGTFRERSQPELAKMSKAQRQEYEKAKKWWEREGKALIDQPPAEPRPEAAPPAPHWFRRTFDTFDQLRETAEEVADVLQAGGEQ